VTAALSSPSRSFTKTASARGPIPRSCRGGVLRYADSIRVPYILARLDELSSRLGPRFAPNEPLRRPAERDGQFYRAYARS